MSFKYTVVCDTLKFVGYDVLENPKEILKVIKDAGYDGVDLPGDPENVNAKELRQIADTVGLNLPEVLGAWAYFHGGEDRDLAGEDEEARKRGIRYAKRTIALAVELGAQFFEICAPQPPIPQIPFPKIPIKTLRKNFMESLREICEYATGRGITILLEPLNCYEAYPGVLTTLYDALSLINELGVNNLGVQPDIFHMNIGEGSIPDALRAAGKHIRHVHLNETNHYSLGTGHADYQAILRTLKEVGFDGYLAIYMPFTTQEIFQVSSRGYGGSKPLAGGSVAVRPELRPILEFPLGYMKQIESAIDLQKGVYR